MVDPSVLPDVLPPGVLDMFQRVASQSASPTRPTSGPGPSAPVTRQPNPDSAAPTPSGRLPPQVLKMLQQASLPPNFKQPANQQPSSRSESKAPQTQPQSPQPVAKSAQISMPENRNSNAIPRELLDMLKQANMGGNTPTQTPGQGQGQQPTAAPSKQSGDPMAALLGRLQEQQRNAQAQQQPSPTRQDPASSLMCKPLEYRYSAFKTPFLKVVLVTSKSLMQNFD